eukprot:XP_023973190.1 nuclear RNA export factor 3-like [Physeter catodon]
MAAWMSHSRKPWQEEGSKVPIGRKYLEDFVVNEALRLQTHTFSSRAACEDGGDRSLPSGYPMGYNKQVTSLQRRARCWHIYQRRYNNWSEEVRSGIHPSSQQQQDGDQATSDVHKDTGVRYAPYAIPSCHWRGNFQKQDETHVNKATEQKPPERKMERNRQDETLGSWFKIRIPFGIKYDEKWLLNLIQKQCSVPFTPVEFHYEKMQAQFFIENANIAFALKNVNGVIYNEANEREKEGTRGARPSWLCFSGPCGSSSSSQVKSAGEMDKGERLEPEGMCADRNPLCTTFPDKSTNISSILELFPKLLTLDGQETSPLAKCGIEASKHLPTCKGNYFGSDELKSLVLQFLQQYYFIYDYGDRQGLAGAYHEEACFSLTIPFHPEDPAPSSLCEHFKDSRNMKKLKDPHLRVQLLKHTKRVIVHTLCVLPKTQHNFSSFVVDTWFQTETLLCFSVSGVFKEVEGSSQGCVRAFTRTFIATPASYSSLCIVNDELFVRDASSSETQSVFSIPVPTPTSSSMHTLSQQQQDIMQASSTPPEKNL